MKKLFLLFIAAFALIFSAKAQYLTAFNNFSTFQMSNSTDHDALKKAVEAIDIAIKDDRSSTSGKTWFYRGYIYQSAWEDTVIRENYTNPLLISSESYQKAFNIGDTKFKQSDDAVKNLIVLSKQLEYQAGLYFEQAVYKEALQHYLEVLKVKDFVTSKSPENKIDEKQAMLMSVVVSQKLNDNTMVKTLLSNFVNKEYDNVLAYSALIDVYLNEDNLLEAKKVIEKASTKYPNDITIVKSRINLYLKEGSAGEHLDEMIKAVEAEPKNHVLHFILGSTYQALKQDSLAEKCYNDAIALKPDFFEALNNISTIYVEDANKYQLLMNDPKVTDAKYKEYESLREKYFKKALPFLEKALEIEPENYDLLRVLKEVYAKLSMYDKSNQIKSKMESLKK